MEQVLINMTGENIDIYDFNETKIRNIPAHGRMYMPVRETKEQVEKSCKRVQSIPILCLVEDYEDDAEEENVSFEEVLYGNFSWSDLDDAELEIYVITTINPGDFPLCDMYPDKPYIFLNPGYTKFGNSIRVTHFIES